MVKNLAPNKFILTICGEANSEGGFEIVVSPFDSFADMMVAYFSAKKEFSNGHPSL